MPPRVDTANVEPDWRESLPPLVRAAEAGDGVAVERLLASGSDPDEADEDGWSALHAAAARDHPAVVAQLLQAGAAVDAREQHGFTPLLNTASAGPEVIEQLLAAGADPMAQDDRFRWRPLDRYAAHANVAGVRLVLAAGARADLPGCSALGDAAEAGCAECVELLLSAGADPAQTWDDQSAAELAAKHGHLELSRRLSQATPDR